MAARSSDRTVVALGVVTSVANAYFQVLAAREQMAIARRNLAAAKAMLPQVEARQRAGKALARLEALIMLYKALGGGWQEGQPQ